MLHDKERVVPPVVFAASWGRPRRMRAALIGSDHRIFG